MMGQRSFKRNVIANYVGYAYVAIIGIVITPFYITYLGSEAYGLIGFYAMLQAMFHLLDMGLTPTMSRETARFHGGATDSISYRRLVRVLEAVFVLTATVGGASLFALSDVIASDWLKAYQLPRPEITRSLQIISVIVALRWMGGLYRGAISGAERLVWLSAFNALIASLRFIGVLPLIVFVDSSPSTFFLYQLLIALVELAGLGAKAHQLLPAVKIGHWARWDWRPLKPVLKFSLTIAVTSSVWVAIIQTDKLVLSGILPLDEYGYFSLAVLVAGVIMVFSVPISNAIMPRLSSLEAQGKHEELITVYRQSTQFVAVGAGSVAATIAFCAQPLLWAWTGDKVISQQAAPILTLYALGNGIMVLAGFPYYLQYAKGDLRLHLIGHVLFAVIMLPLTVWAALHYGGVGSGYVWMSMTLLMIFTWLPLVHKRFCPGLNVKWYGTDVLPILVSVVISASLLGGDSALKENRVLQIVEISGIGAVVLLVGVLASSQMRLIIKTWLAPRERRKW